MKNRAFERLLKQSGKGDRGKGDSVCNELRVFGSGALAPPL